MSRNISGGGLDGCHMFLRDYTNWSMHTVDEWLANYPNVTTTVVECRYGYEYDAHPYEDTIVTEVSHVCCVRVLCVNVLHTCVVCVCCVRVLCACVVYGCCVSVLCKCVVCVCCVLGFEIL